MSDTQLNLRGLRGAGTYRRLLQIPPTSIGADSTIRPVYDGEGDALPLRIGTTGVEVTTVPATDNAVVNKTYVDRPAPWNGSTPLLLRDLVSHRYNPKHFGCVGDGVTDDTVAMDFAFRWCASQGMPLWLDGGTYILRPATAMWNELALPTQQATAVTIDYDNFHLIGAGGFIELRAPPDVIPSGIKYYAFMTPEYLTPGAITNAKFEGSFFRHSGEGYSSGLPSQYVAALCGVEKVLVRDCHLENASARRGHGFAFYDSRDVTIENFSIRSVQQGVNVVYGRDFKVNGYYGRDFVEAFDINWPIFRGVFNNMVFLDSPASDQSQCFDVVGQDLVITNVVAENIFGNGIGVYSKKSYSTYAEHKQSVIDGTTGTQANPVGTTRVSVSGVRFKSVTNDVNGYPAIFVMNERQTDDDKTPVPVGITVSDVSMEGCGPVAFQEGIDLVARDISLHNPFVDSRTDYSAFCARRSTLGEPGRSFSQLTGTFTNISVYNSPHTGVTIDGLQSGEVSNIHVSGYGLDPIPAGDTPYGVAFRNLGRRDGIVNIKGIEALDTAAAGTPPLLLRGGSVNYDQNQSSQIFLSDNIRLSGTIGEICAGANDWLYSTRPLKLAYSGRISVLNPSFLSNTADGQKYIEIPLYTQGLGEARFLFSQIIFVEAPFGGGTCSFTIRKRSVAGVLSAILTHDVADNTVTRGSVSLPTGSFVVDRPEATLYTGEQLVLTCGRDTAGTEGLGLNCPDVRVSIALLQYENV